MYEPFFDHQAETGCPLWHPEELTCERDERVYAEHRYLSAYWNWQAGRPHTTLPELEALRMIYMWFCRRHRLAPKS